VPLLILAAGVAVAAAIEYRNGFAGSCDRESNYFCLRVVDASHQAPFGRAHALVLDHLLHGINHETEPAMLGGSYTQPRAVRHMTREANIVVAELDPVVTATVVETMFVDPEDFTIRHGDARATLYRQPPASFDVIVTDAFHDIAIPYHLVTLEYARLAKSKLKPGGLFTTNVVDVFPDPRMVKSLVNTLRQAFAEVDVWLDRIPEQPQRMTYVISASEQAIGRDVLESRDGLRRAWLRINEPLENTGTALSDLPVFSDDFVPVERLLTPEGK
jgi:spermidine synthase